MKIRIMLFAIVILSGCSETGKKGVVVFDDVNYSFRSIVVQNEDKKTFAESENAQYKKQYDDKVLEWKKIYDKFVKSYKELHTKYPVVTAERLQEIEEQERRFESFIEFYAEKNCCLYLRSSWYHYYGALIDMINLRINHLKIHMRDTK